DIGAGDDGGQRVEVGRAQDRSGRVVRRVDHDHARAGRDGGRDLVPGHAVACLAEAHLHRHRHAAGQLD
nr:hypothetical protein [Tanacetum cinerariifolium]